LHAVILEENVRRKGLASFVVVVSASATFEIFKRRRAVSTSDPASAAEAGRSHLLRVGERTTLDEL
jgi:hypothetical protein